MAVFERCSDEGFVGADRLRTRAQRDAAGDRPAAGPVAGVTTQPAARRVLIAVVDPLTPQMAGPAIRAWHMAAALAAEHQVVLATTGECSLEDERFRACHVDEHGLRRLEQWCEVLVVRGFIMQRHRALATSNKVVIVDVYDPMHLEQLEQGRDAGERQHLASVRAVTAVLNQQLLRGDFFVCASPKQRDFWLGALAALGRVNPLTYAQDKTMRSLIDVVPSGFPDVPPGPGQPVLRGVVPGIGADDKVVLWGGGIYNWLDPLTLVRAIDRLRHRLPEVRLYFMGLAHPTPDVPRMTMVDRTIELSDGLGLTGSHVFFNQGWVSYEERQAYLLEADVGVSTHLDHVETAFSFRTRLLDCLWASLPMVATSGDGFSEIIDADNLGLTVPPGDVEALDRALFRLLDDEDLRAACRKNISQVAPAFTWSSAMEPLLGFCRAPRRAPDLVAPGVHGRVPLRPPTPDTRRSRLRSQLQQLLGRGGLGRAFLLLEWVLTRRRRQAIERGARLRDRDALR